MEPKQDVKLTWAQYVVTATAVAMSCYHLYTCIFGIPESQMHRMLHLMFACVLTFFIYNVSGKKNDGKVKVWDILLTAATVVSLVYMILNLKVFQNRISFVTPLTTAQIAVFVVLLIVVLEATRRLTGPTLPIACIVFILYALFGNHLPGILGHNGFTVQKLLEQVMLTSEGVFGSSLGITATYVVVFIIFASFLEITGAGQFFIDLLRDGWYKGTELEPAPGFTIKEPVMQEVYIKGGESKVLTFENVPKNAIIVEKYDSVTGEALPGCTFQLKYLGGTSGTGGTNIGTKVTGKNGTAIWTGLNPGAYVLEEVDPADGYNIIQSSETIMLADSGEQSVVTVRFKNAPDGTLLIRKVCATNPSVALQNAEFKVMYADGTLIGDSNGVYRTDEAGEIRITGLKPGKSVVVTETRAPAGFILDTQSQTVQIKEGKKERPYL